VLARIHQLFKNAPAAGLHAVGRGVSNSPFRQAENAHEFVRGNANPYAIPREKSTGQIVVGLPQPASNSHKIVKACPTG
jgi:hypothetical protein